jgi:quercetin dioxygenase-like cupin family protein
MRLITTLALVLPLLASLSGCMDAERTSADAPPDKAVVVHPADYRVVKQPWGELTWYIAADMKNSSTMTVGQCIIHPGQENPRHYHPNCDEVLHVISGTIVQSMEDGRTETMHTGDTVSIPAGIHHNRPPWKFSGNGMPTRSTTVCQTLATACPSHEMPLMLEAQRRAAAEDEREHL